jgi:hypothetical protein
MKSFNVIFEWSYKRLDLIEPCVKFFRKKGGNLRFYGQKKLIFWHLVLQPLGNAIRAKHL